MKKGGPIQKKKGGIGGKKVASASKLARKKIRTAGAGKCAASAGGKNTEKRQEGNWPNSKEYFPRTDRES